MRSGNETFPIGPSTLWSVANLNITAVDDNVTVSICATEMRDNPIYVQGYILLANFIVMAFLPFLILTITNTMLYRTITTSSTNNRRTNNRHKRDQSIAMILVGIVIVFVLCNMFRIIINLYEVFHLAFQGGDVTSNWPNWYCQTTSVFLIEVTLFIENFLNSIYVSRCAVLSHFSHLLLVLNSSVNIIIYGWKDAKFRELLINLVNLNCLKSKVSENGSNKNVTEISLFPLNSYSVRKENPDNSRNVTLVRATSESVF